MKTQMIIVMVWVFLIGSVILLADPMTTAFTYQGRLLEDNVPADGQYDFKCYYYHSDPNDEVVVIELLSGPIEDVQVTDGYFIFELPLSDSFNGDARWLGIEVRPGESTNPDDFVALDPPIEITPTPYAFYALQTRGISVDEDLNVGIGNQDPYFRLDIGNVEDNNNAIRIVSQEWGELLFDDGEEDHYLASGAIQYSHETDSLYFTTRYPGESGIPSLKMIITADGNIGIGEEFPTEKLDVAGTVKADDFVGSGSGLTGVARVVNLDMHDVPRWSGTYLTAGSIYDDGTHITIGDSPLSWDQLLSVKTDSDPISLHAIMMTEDPIPFGERFAVRAYTSGNSVVNSYGVSGSSWSSIGPNYGVFGNATNPSTGDNYGIYGRANNTGDGDAWAGYFDGDGYFSDYLGIGTESPSSRLDIGSTSDTANSIRVASSSTGQASIIFYDADSTACGGMEYFHTNDSLYFVTRDPGDTSSTIKMAIDSAGNVGIGEEYPLSKLEVVGTIHSTTGGFKFPDGTTQTTASTADGHSLDAADGNPTDAVYVDNSGNVGIGTSSPSSKLDIEGINPHLTLNTTGAGSYESVIDLQKDGANKWSIGYNSGSEYLYYYNPGAGGAGTAMVLQDSTGNVGIGTASPTHLLHVNGIARSTQATWATSSDRRVKKNITEMKNGVKTLTKLRPVSFEYTEEYIRSNNAPDDEQFGFVAQEVKEVIPEMVTYTSENIGDATIEDFHLLNSGKLIPLLVQAVKEQQVQIEAMQAEIEQLKGQIKN